MKQRSPDLISVRLTTPTLPLLLPLLLLLAAVTASQDARAADASLDLARPIPAGEAGRKPPRATSVVLGERWGCASLASETDSAWQCWDTRKAPPKGKSPRSPQAWPVPWLNGRTGLHAGPDRLCQLATPDLAFRCWAPPQRGERAGRELRPKMQWLNPHRARWDDYDNRESATTAFVGGTFACLRALRGNLWCLGDNRFGQLGAPQSDQTAFLPFEPASAVGLGTWHGCAIASGRVSCWGRGDAGQLGAPAKDQCVVNGRPVACAKAPQLAGMDAPAPVLVIVAGDLFTCVTAQGAVRCWGANRDGFFGTPGSCPEALRKAWPTPAGNVAAPQAACPPEPVSVPAGVNQYEFHFTGGPRGLCFPGQANGPWRCVGAIPTPRDEVGAVVASPGQDASACTVKDGRVLCWGEAYAPPNARDTLVPITLVRTTPVDEFAVIDRNPAATWDDGCLVRQGCHSAPVVLPACAASAAGAREWSMVLAGGADALVGKVVKVRGPLGIDGVSTTFMGCGETPSGRGCCNGTKGPIAVGGAPVPVSIDGLHCGGDDSRLCCNAPAYGQSVIATGRLEKEESGWRLADTKLCAEKKSQDKPAKKPEKKSETSP